ncbi:hypothetical protein V6N11_068228 [Hibiscus sabdariffa]|uniref:Uncharacterized protein n=2 Tax=Hibiscus sabdariffa TaxID=183260 RepID=A0ABR2C1E2_9ROSI
MGGNETLEESKKPFPLPWDLSYVQAWTLKHPNKSREANLPLDKSHAKKTGPAPAPAPKSVVGVASDGMSPTFTKEKTSDCGFESHWAEETADFGSQYQVTNFFEGEIPSGIGNLKKFEVFRAGGNKNLKGSIPKEIGNCNELQNLYLYQNSISSPIPRQVGQPSKPQSLLLWQNSLVGTIQDELGNCRELIVVDLLENLLTCSIPSNIGKLSKFQELQLRFNHLSGTIPAES